MASIGFDFKPVNTVLSFNTYTVPSNRYSRLRGFLSFGQLIVDGNTLFVTGSTSNRVYVDIWLKAGQALSFGSIASTSASFSGHISEYQE